jgi:hypothetical protein
MAFRVEISLQAEHDAEANAFASLAKFTERCPIAPENSRFPFEVRQLFYG